MHTFKLWGWKMQNIVAPLHAAKGNSLALSVIFPQRGVVPPLIIFEPCAPLVMENKHEPVREPALQRILLMQGVSLFCYSSSWLAACWPGAAVPVVMLALLGVSSRGLPVCPASISLLLSRRLTLEGTSSSLGVSQRAGTLGGCCVLCQLRAGSDRASAPGGSEKHLQATANAVVCFSDPLDSLVPSVAWDAW